MEACLLLPVHSAECVKHGSCNLEIYRQTDHEGWNAVLDAAIDDVSRRSIASAGASLALTEFRRTSMVIGGHLQDVLRRRNEHKLAERMDEGRVEGEAEANTRWRAWYSRLLEAQARGEPFDEPPTDDAPRSDNDQSSTGV